MSEKNTQQLHARIHSILDQILKTEGRLNQLEHRFSDGEQKSEDQAAASQLNLGTREQRVLVSMESFFEFNFEFTQSLESLVEEKIVDSYQCEWAKEAEAESSATSFSHREQSRTPDQLNRRLPR